MPLKIGYWNIRGLGAPLRMICEYVNICYESINYMVIESIGIGNIPQYDASSWFNEKKMIMKKNPLINLPYIEDGDVIVTQSNACFLYLGHKFGLLGSTPQDKLDCEQLLCELMDLRNSMISVFYNGFGNNENNELDKLMNASQLNKLEHWLSLKKTKFLICNDKPCVPDFHLFELLDQLRILSLTYQIRPWNVHNKFPNLNDFYSNFDQLPFLFKYRSSLLAKLPINNKMAMYGSKYSVIPDTVQSSTSVAISAEASSSSSSSSSTTPSKKKKGSSSSGGTKQSIKDERIDTLIREAIEKDSNVHIRNEKTLIYSRGPHNSAFMFLKPHAVTNASIALVKGFLTNGGFKVISEGRISCDEIDSKSLIDKHYYGIASKAMSLKPNELFINDQAKDHFKVLYGLTWEQGIEQNVIYNAVDACSILGINTDELDYQWTLSKNSRKRLKLGRGFYCALIEMKGMKVFVINGFFMSMRAKFTKPGDVIYFFSVEWDPSDTPWAWFRSRGCGDTDPAIAPETSLRSLVFSQWEELGLESPPNMMDNGVHVSASPFEALVEHMNWFGSIISNDSFGKELLNAGIFEESILRWSLDPQVLLRSGGYGSLFSLLEDRNSADCIAELLALQTRELALSSPPFPTLEIGENGMEFVHIRSGNSEATVYLHGGHVTSWKVAGNEKLFVSNHAIFNGSKAIRGGIPVCWPQFSDMGPCKAQHGFARNFKWTLVEESNSQRQEGTCLLRLDSTMVQAMSEAENKSSFIKGWKFPSSLLNSNNDDDDEEEETGGGGGDFILEMRISVSDYSFKQEFTVKNPDQAQRDLSFTCALHTYFGVSNANQASVEGLFGTNYLDNLEKRISKKAEDDNGNVTVLFKDEVDRIYLNVPKLLTIRDGNNGHHGIQIKTNKQFYDAIVWNPYIKKSKNMNDFGDNDYEQMLCCEVGTVTKDHAVTLKPNQVWVGIQELRAI